MNVVVLAAHGLSCHWLGPYGNAWVSTPAFDALACEAVVFDRHLADDLSPAGFRTSCPEPVLAALGAAGVTRVLLDDHRGEPQDERPWDHVVRPAPGHPTPGEALFAAVRAALDHTAGRERWLMSIETDRLIPPWDFEFETYQHYAAETARFGGDGETDGTEDDAPIDEPARGPVAEDDDSVWHRLHNSFGAAVTSFDGELKALVDLFRARGLDRSAAWVVTAGYGWPLGEHGLVGPDGSRMHEELVHLPLLIRLPGRREGMRRVPGLTQTCDLAPTLLDLFGVATVPGVPSTSLLPLTAGVRAVLRTDARSAHGDERRVQTDEWAYLPPAGDRPARLYRKPDDIWEVNDLAPRHPDECDRLAALLDGTPPEGPTS